nr:FtsQ-type POTRA domain-containing protein [Nitrospiraceae bacterium]
MNRRKGRNRKKTKTAGRPGGRAFFLKMALAAALLIALFMALSAYAGSTGMFPLRKVVFEGNKTLSSGELLALLRVRAGQNMLEMSKKDLSERLLSCPWVKTAAVRKEIFTGRIVVRVSERKPFVLIKRNGTLWLSDVRGRLLEPLRSGTAPFLPVIDADVKDYPETFTQAMLLARRLRDRGYFQDAVLISAACPPEDLAVQEGGQVGGVDKDGGSDKDAEGGKEAGGVIIRFGAGDYRRKLDELAALEPEIAKRKIS